MDRRSMIAHIRSTAEALGIGLDEFVDLAAAARDDVQVPTVAEFYERVTEVESRKRGWSKRKGLHDSFVERFGGRPIDAVLPADIAAYAGDRGEAVRDREQERQENLADRGLPNAPRRTGKGAERNVIEAARAFLAVAVSDGLLTKNPGHGVPLPKRPRPRKRALTIEQLDELFAWAAAEDDVELTTLLLWFHLETGARRGGAIGLRLGDVKQAASQVALFEKGDVERLQPVSEALVDALIVHGRTRGAAADTDPLFRYLPKRGDPRPRRITRKTYEQLVTRMRRELPWAGELWTRLHDLRHTAIAHVERISGSTAVARLFAGHADRTTTDGYDRADEVELRAAVERWAARIREDPL